MGSLKEDLGGGQTELIETHTAWVFLGPDAVLKVKKPVDYGFLDFTSLERRKVACDAEVRLNARLAPDVYRGVLPVTRDATGKHRIGGDGTVVDYAVSMRRLPDAARADVLLGEGRLGARDVELLAEHLALFHDTLGSTAAAAAPFGAPDAISRNIVENFAQARGSVSESITEEEAKEIERGQIRFLERGHELFERRAKSGKVRDGHGDLRLEHVYFESRAAPTIIDCIEFNDRFRYADVCSDIAFLSMDLRRLGRAGLAERFLSAYARASGDYELYEVVDFYEGYRAYVRGKVSSMLAADRDADVDVRNAAQADARSFFVLSLLEGRKPLIPPTLVAVGGVIASGKSTVAERLGTFLGAPVISADRTRKELLGVEATTKVHDAPWKGSYSSEWSERVYAELFRRAGHVLASGRPVVLDASFRTAAWRSAARATARERDVRFHFVECKAGPEECRRRLVERSRVRSVSDGRLEIFDEFVAKFEPVTELPPAEHFVVDTERPLTASLHGLLEELPSWPEGSAT